MPVLWGTHYGMTGCHRNEWAPHGNAARALSAWARQHFQCCRMGRGAVAIADLDRAAFWWVNCMIRLDTTTITLINVGVDQVDVSDFQFI